jgi:hypothetical protein
MVRTFGTNILMFLEKKAAVKFYFILRAHYDLRQRVVRRLMNCTASLEIRRRREKA